MMLGFIYRLVQDFEHEHGIHPNLLYLNQFHSEHLKSAFAEGITLSTIMQFLNMELVIENDIMHPHVAWTQSAQRIAS